MPVDAGHVHIHQHEVVVVRLQRIERGLAVRDDVVAVAAGVEDRRDHALVQLVVVRDQDAERPRGRGGRGGLGRGAPGPGQRHRGGRRIGQRAGFEPGRQLGERDPARLLGLGGLRPHHDQRRQGGAGNRAGRGDQRFRLGRAGGRGQQQRPVRLGAGPQQRRVERAEAGQAERRALLFRGGGEVLGVGFLQAECDHLVRPGNRIPRRHRGDRQLEPEGAARARLAVQADGAAERLHQAPADGQAEPGAAEAGADRGIGLGEALEDARMRLRRHADPGIRHLQPQPHAALRPHRAGAHQHAAEARELDGVADQVEQDLLDVAAVPAERERRPGIDMEAKRSPFAPRGGEQDVADLEQEARAARTASPPA